jgi:predicted molibdopterin-dependent oxidoreductase YjgC
MAALPRRLPGIERGAPISIRVNGASVEAYAGENLATVLMAAGYRVFRQTDASESPRGLFCGMGTCFDCLVTVDGLTNQRACVTEARAGCEVQTAVPNMPNAPNAPNMAK